MCMAWQQEELPATDQKRTQWGQSLQIFQVHNQVFLVILSLKCIEFRLRTHSLNLLFFLWIFKLEVDIIAMVRTPYYHFYMKCQISRRCCEGFERVGNGSMKVTFSLDVLIRMYALIQTWTASRTQSDSIQSTPCFRHTSVRTYNWWKCTGHSSHFENLKLMIAGSTRRNFAEAAHGWIFWE